MTEEFLSREIRPQFSRSLADEQRGGDVYLANHSLGRMPDAVTENVAHGLDLWARHRGDAWEKGWAAEIEAVRAAVARLVGLNRPDAVVPKASAGQGLRAILNARIGDQPLRVVTSSLEFDSISWILQTYTQRGFIIVDEVAPTADEQGIPLLEPGPVITAIRKGCDLVIVSQVAFGSGQILDGVRDIADAAHAAGAWCILDTYHSAGVVPVSLADLDADFLIGGGYKYLRGGPGACWLVVHPRIIEESRRTLDTGWFAKARPFAYERGTDAEWAPGGDGWLESTPPVLTAFQSRPGLEIVLELGVPALRAHSLELLTHWRELLRARNVDVLTPADPTKFGAFALHPGADATLRAEKARAAGVDCDARGRFVRTTPDFLNSVEALTRAADRLALAWA